MTARSHGKLRIKYWTNRTGPTTTSMDSEIIHQVVEIYLNRTKIISRVDDNQLHGNSVTSNTLRVNRGNILIRNTFIIFHVKTIVHRKSRALEFYMYGT
jgi:hypothetical protein